VKIILLANQDYVSHKALITLTSALRSHSCQVLLSPRVGPAKEALDPALVALSRFDSQQLENDLKSHSKEPEGNMGSDLSAALSHSYGVPVYPVESINRAKGLQLVQQFQPDLILSIRFGFILNTAVIAIPRCGVINLHSGLLPEYKGIMATFWAMLDGCSSYGSTLHYIDDKRIDSGPIIERLEYKLDLNRSYFDNLLVLYTSGVTGMIQAVRAIDEGGSPRTWQPIGVGNYFSVPKKSDVQQFLDLGLRLFDPDTQSPLAE